MEKITAKGWLKICAFFFLLSVPVFLGGCGSSGTNLPAFNIAGNWFIYDATNGVAVEQGPNVFNFTTSDTTLGGTTSLGQVITGTSKDMNVSFSWKGSDGAKYSYDGTVGPDGGTMQGTWSNSSGQNGTWIGLIDAAPSANVAGSWVLTTSGSQGTISSDTDTFVQSGNGITMTTPQGPQSPVGTISYLNIAFFAIGSDGATYTYIGKVDSSTSISGTWTNTSGQSGTWSATKA